MRCDVVVHAERAVTAGGEGPAAVGITDGRIVAVERGGAAGAALSGEETLRLGDELVLLPGLVDTHVHVNEPGRTEWEGFASATRAAAAGGVTTIVDMPLNSIPPTTTVEALRAKQAVARGPGLRRRGVLGRRRPGQPRRPAPAARGRCLRLQVLPAPLGGRRVPAPRRRWAEGRPRRGRGLRRPGHRPRRGPRDHRRVARCRRPGVCRFPRLPSEGGGGARDRPGRRGRPGDRGAGAHPAPLGRRRAAADRRRPGRGRAPQRRDVPALPDADGRGDP